MSDIVVLEDLKEPVWGPQDFENDAQYEYFNLYLEQPSNTPIRVFHENLLEAFKNKENEDFKNVKIPSESTLVNWCTNNKWIARKDAYVFHRSQEIRENLEAMENAFVEKFHQKNFDLIDRAQERIWEEFEAGTISGYGMAQFTNAIRNLRDEYRLDMGKSTENTAIAATAELNAKVVSKDTVMEKVLKLSEEFEDDEI